MPGLSGRDVRSRTPGAFPWLRAARIRSPNRKCDANPIVWQQMRRLGLLTRDPCVIVRPWDSSGRQRTPERFVIAQMTPFDRYRSKRGFCTVAARIAVLGAKRSKDTATSKALPIARQSLIGYGGHT